jgi:basic amino acid/polyamine antiporter, APA family
MVKRETDTPESGMQPAQAVPGSAPVSEGPALARRLGLFDITMLVMGSVIGTGIFALPHVVAGRVADPFLILLAWTLGGLVTLAGSLVYAELTRRRPQVGGQYAFLKEAYHPLVAFLYGWALLWVIQSGGAASVAVIFSDYFIALLHITGGWLRPDGDFQWLDVRGTQVVLTTLAIGTFTAINCLGVRTGGTTQNIFMSLKIAAILALVVSGLLFTGRSEAPAERSPIASANWDLVAAFGAAMVAVFFSYGGSHTTTFMAGEVRDVRRNLPRGLVTGVCGVIVLYLAVNVVCLRALGVDRLKSSETPASDVMRLAFGEFGAGIISVGIAISALGFLSQATLTSPRVYYAMARDGLFFQSVARVHPQSRAPVMATLLQGVFAMAIAVSGTFGQIVNYVMSCELIFFSLTALSLFVIRRRDAGSKETTRLTMPGHPATTLVYVVVNLAVLFSLFYKEPRNSAIGVGILLAGVPVYFFWKLRNRAKQAAVPVTQ